MAATIDKKATEKNPLEVLVFQRPDSNVQSALRSVQESGADPFVLCVIPPGNDSATIRLFWERQIVPQNPDVPLLIAHEGQMSLAEILAEVHEHLHEKHPGRTVRYKVLESSSQSWGSLKRSLLLRKLKRKLDVSFYEGR